MSLYDFSKEDTVTEPQMPPLEQPPTDLPPPPVGITPPQVLAREAADGRRGAAWRLLHWIMEDDPRAIVAVSSLDDDRLARNLLEFIALGTWAGKSFVVPVPLRSAHARTRLRTLFMPGSGMNPFRAERVLVAAMPDRRPAVRENAAHILGLIATPNATPILIEALKDPVPAVRLQAAKALGRIGNASSVPSMISALRTADEQMGSQIFSSLVRIGPAAVPELLIACTNSSAWIRWQSMRALGEICDYRALPSLVQGLRDPDHSVAWVAARGLTRFGKACIGPVLRLLVTTETSPWLVEAASFVLHDLYVHDQKLKPYLEPVVQSMHGVAYQIATPNAARKALSQMVTHGLVSVPS